MREEIEGAGVVHRAVRILTLPLTLDDFRLIELTGDKKKVYHGIGPGLELEIDAARAGPVMVSLYVSGQAYHFLGDLDVSFSDSQERVLGQGCTPPFLCRPPVSPETASWQFEKKRWAFRGGVGLRFHWMPE